MMSIVECLDIPPNPHLNTPQYHCCWSHGDEDRDQKYHECTVELSLLVTNVHLVEHAHEGKFVEQHM
jgi:hypothetical protein